MKNKTKNSTRAAVSRYDEKFERAMIRMPIGTRAMIADTDLSVNAFANDAIERQLKALEMFDFEDDIKSMTPPKEVDGKINNEFNAMINATDPLNNPIPVSLVFNPKIIPIKNSANKITLNANKNPLIINKSPFHNLCTSKHDA